MSEFNDWMSELSGTRLEDGRWVRPRRPSGHTLALGVFAAGLLIAVLAAANLILHGA